MRATLATAVAACAFATEIRAQTLANTHVRAEFDARGLRAVTDLADGHRHGMEADGFSVTIDNETLANTTLATPTRQLEPQRVTYRYASGVATLIVRYELRPDWRFVSKQIEVRAGSAAAVRIREAHNDFDRGARSTHRA